jgi:hypothetical protein
MTCTPKPPDQAEYRQPLQTAAGEIIPHPKQPQHQRDGGHHEDVHQHEQENALCHLHDVHTAGKITICGRFAKTSLKAPDPKAE